MNATLVLVQVLNGLQLGVLLFLIAAGLTPVFGVMDFVDLAHGVQYMLGAYLAVTFHAVTGSFVAALVLGLVAALALGLLLEFAVLRHVYGRDHLAQVIDTVATLPGDRHLRHHPGGEPGRETHMGWHAARHADPGGAVRLVAADGGPALSGVAPRHHCVRPLARVGPLLAGEPHRHRHARARRRRQ